MYWEKEEEREDLFRFSCNLAGSNSTILKLFYKGNRVNTLDHELGIQCSMENLKVGTLFLDFLHTSQNEISYSAGYQLHDNIEWVGSRIEVHKVQKNQKVRLSCF